MIRCAPGDVRLYVSCSGSVHNGVCNRCGQRVESTGGQHSTSFDPFSAMEHTVVRMTYPDREPGDERQLKLPGTR